jgi:hypothetical protein
MEAMRVLSLFLASQAIFDSACEHIAFSLDPSCKRKMGKVSTGFKVELNGETGILAAKVVISNELSIVDSDYDWKAAWDTIALWRAKRNDLAHRIVSVGPQLISLAADEHGHVASFGAFDVTGPIDVDAAILEQIIDAFRTVFHAISMADMRIHGDFKKVQ